MLNIRLKSIQDAEILNVRDIAAVFQVDRETIYAWKKQGLLKMHKVGGRFYADREDVEKLIHASKVSK